MSGLRVSMDIGGTFTDVVAYDERTGRYRAGKASTTPHDLTEGVIAALSTVLPPGEAGPADISFLVHGTTQGLNAFLQRRGTRVLLLASEGASDTYHIARGPRTRLYDLHYRKPEPLVPRGDIEPIGGRLAADGSELTPLDEDAVRRAARRFGDEGFEAVAVAYLFSHANPAHELRTRELLREELGEDVTVSLSHEAANEWREYERTSSAVLEAYIGPVVQRYLSTLGATLKQRGLAVPLHVMQSSGGVNTADSARHRPLQTLLSGPVGGTMGGVALSRTLERPHLICMDMGGTSFDVSLVVDGRPDVTSEARLEGLPVLMSVVDIHTIGAGGGSVAWQEAGGLRVGPRSAGATPGPACYARGGTEPTVTDADLVLGRIDEATFAGGEFAPRSELALEAVGSLGERLGLDTVAMAEGICEVAGAKMAQAVRTITVSRGIEPRQFSLVAFGGAGPMHAVALARELGIPEVVVPRFPGAFSAWGMLETEIRRDFAEPFFRPEEDLDRAEMAELLEKTAAEALGSLDSEGVPAARRRTECAADIRYQAQEYTLTVPLTDPREPLHEDFPARIAARFADLHQERYGHANPGAPLEFVALRTTALGALDAAPPELLPAAAHQDFAHRTRPVVFDGRPLETVVVDREVLAPGHELSGPALVREPTATTVVPPGHRLRLDAHGSLVIREEKK
ncbi:hydantoinase/oxoprolinase family protein [Streptomyces sp. XM4193]|uniref:hydantoinase/oxoprolinase family protein n=1 Tax=Streptomyces sp. XM4193 TaxID=2929782 RepID=UPI001FF9AF5A|nr:hydantoinase/oxoprolinase family protein [Streptomyces sp. XM4193]MCK1798180.1 hydantoinase/oxoprolinase family protein [Streptomyces sp. XM4193]